MKYKVRHVTDYRYSNPVDLGAHMLHLTPRALPGQTVGEARISIAPKPSRISDHPDHFGNNVSWVFMDLPHERFVITVEASVEVEFPAPPAIDDTPPWEDVAEAARRGGGAGDFSPAWQAGEYIFESPMVATEDAAGAFAAPCFTPGRPILAALLDLNARINKNFAFKPGVTTIRTPVSRILASRAGVCQDFTHVMLSCLRWHGIPARYVSGYLRTYTPPGAPVLRGADQSHAWVGAWMGPQHGWIDLDPTNNLVVHDEHVVLAWGRDYGDISPVRGVITGGGKHTVTVGVDLEPED